VPQIVKSEPVELPGFVRIVAADLVGDFSCAPPAQFADTACALTGRS
jgi:hypothetical protein